MDGLSVVQRTRILEYQDALRRRDIGITRIGDPPLDRQVEDAETHLRALGLDPELAQLVQLTASEWLAIRGDR